MSPWNKKPLLSLRVFIIKTEADRVLKRATKSSRSGTQNKVSGANDKSTDDVESIDGMYQVVEYANCTLWVCPQEGELNPVPPAAGEERCRECEHRRGASVETDGLPLEALDDRMVTENSD
jgi:hypothetical protein